MVSNKVSESSLATSMNPSVYCSYSVESYQDCYGNPQDLEGSSRHKISGPPSPEDIKCLNTHLGESITGLDYQKIDNINFKRVARN